MCILTVDVIENHLWFWLFRHYLTKKVFFPPESLGLNDEKQKGLSESIFIIKTYRFDLFMSIDKLSASDACTNAIRVHFPIVMSHLARDGEGEGGLHTQTEIEIQHTFPLVIKLSIFTSKFHSTSKVLKVFPMRWSNDNVEKKYWQFDINL